MSDEDLHPEGDDPGYVTVPAPDDGETTEGEPPVDDDAGEQEPTLEDVAARMGWAPRDQWKGDPDKWKPASEFVATTADINSKLSTKLKTFEDQLSRINRTNEAMMERALAEQRQKLLQERQEAFEVGDSEKFNEIDKKLGELPQAVSQTTPPPETQEFIERHKSWFNVDQEATAWAVSRADQLGKQGITSAARQLSIIERELPTYFPEYAPSEAPKPKPAALTQPGARSATKRGKTFADLPKEAQEAAAYFEKKGVSREDYVKSYFEQEGL